MGQPRHTLDLAVDRLRSRELFGRKLGEMRYWQDRLAERATELEAARAMYQKAAVRLDRGDRSGEPEASMAESFATRLANDLAHDAVQIYGGYGFARQVSATGETLRALTTGLSHSWSGWGPDLWSAQNRQRPPAFRTSRAEPPAAPLPKGGTDGERDGRHPMMKNVTDRERVEGMQILAWRAYGRGLGMNLDDKE